jgi:hypothetical protein
MARLACRHFYCHVGRNQYFCSYAELYLFQHGEIRNNAIHSFMFASKGDTVWLKQWRRASALTRVCVERDYYGWYPARDSKASVTDRSLCCFSSYHHADNEIPRLHIRNRAFASSDLARTSPTKHLRSRRPLLLSITPPPTAPSHLSTTTHAEPTIRTLKTPLPEHSLKYTPFAKADTKNE